MNGSVTWLAHSVIWVEHRPLLSSMSNMMAGFLSRLKEWFGPLRRHPVERRPYEDLKHIHLRRFATADATRFTRLWCEIAAICNVPPLGLHEEDRISDLFPKEGTLVWPSHRFEELEFLIVDERRERTPAGPDLNMVGELLDHLLFSDSGSPILDAIR
jgi:hypothetical protein